jgi:hypothetical protein
MLRLSSSDKLVSKLQSPRRPFLFFVNVLVTSPVTSSVSSKNSSRSFQKRSEDAAKGTKGHGRCGACSKCVCSKDFFVRKTFVQKIFA